MEIMGKILFLISMKFNEFFEILVFSREFERNEKRGKNLRETEILAAFAAK